MNLIRLAKFSRNTIKSISLLQNRCLHDIKPSFSGTFHKVIPESEKSEFLNTLPTVIKQLTTEGAQKDIPFINEHFARTIRYNAPWHGFGMVLPHSYKMLKGQSDHLSQEDLKLATIIGWCVEFSFCFFIVMDDMMDKNVRRRGRPVWHSLDDIGLLAMNDAILVQSGIYELLYKHLKDKPYYMDILRDFQLAIHNVSFGQSLDGLMPHQRNEDGTIQLSQFNLSLHKSICLYKSGLILYSLPGIGALRMAGYEDPELIKKAQDIYYDMGWYVQSQNDFLDYYGHQHRGEEDGTDILMGKCSWPISQAMEVVSPKQMKILKENYGFDDREKIARVFQVYDEIDLPGLWSKWETNLRAEILRKESEILKDETSLPPQFFSKLLEPGIIS